MQDIGLRTMALRRVILPYLAVLREPDRPLVKPLTPQPTQFATLLG